ncbi:CD209 antigen-like protein C [Discoglossus pictus]
MYADFKILEQAAQVGPNPETLRRDFSENTSEYVICNKPERSLRIPYWRWLLAGKIILLLLVIIICLLSLYLQLKAPLHQVLEEKAELSMNHSLCQEEVQGERALTFDLRSNLSSLIQDSYTKMQKELDRINKRCQISNNSYNSLQAQYRKLMEKHCLIRRDGPLLKNCNGNVCPYCPPGWQLFGFSCYLLTSHAQNWEESLHWCRKQKGHLTVINSKEEQQFLQNIVKGPSWIGLSDSFFEGDWRWVDGTPYDTTPHFWPNHQPDNNGDEDCVSMSPGTLWNDNKCNKLFCAICECHASKLTLEEDTLGN